MEGIREAVNKNMTEENMSTSPIVDSPVLHRTYDFSGIIKIIAYGVKITREEWGTEEEYGFLKDDRLMIHHKDGTDHLWILSVGDLEAIDWYSF
jgi:hypothetical protein